MLQPFYTVFPPDEQRRVQSQSIRYDIAMEDSKTVLDEHLKDYLSPEVLLIWGEPDRARNALASVSHALSTPGHYGRAPTVIGPDQAVADRLNDEMRTIWPGLQHAEFLTYACGSVATRLELLPEDEDGDADLIQHVVPAHQCWAIAGRHPTRPVVFRQLRVVVAAVDGAEAKEMYAWTEWDIRDLGAPVHRIVQALPDGQLGADLTQDVRPEIIDYPNRRPDGRPYMPWTIDRSHDTGDLWNWKRGGGAARGSLMGMMLATATNVAALRSTGKVTLMIACKPTNTRTVHDASGASIQTFDAQPGAFLALEPTNPGTTQPSVVEVGEVDTLPALSAYTDKYMANLAQDMGVTPSDAQRTGANPASGIALTITNETKRLEQRRRGELARQADEHRLRTAAYLLGLAADGIGVLYDEIELSAQEVSADLAVDEKEIAMGIASRIDVLVRRRPGMSREQAIRELQRIAEDEKAVANQTGVSA
jgi:hypothetical protein